MTRASGTTLPVLRGRPPAELARVGHSVPVTAQRRLPVRRKQPNKHVERMTVVIRAVVVARSKRHAAVRAAPRYTAALPVPPAPKPSKVLRLKKAGSGLLKKAQAFMRYMAD